jgi:hypothetical protein
LVPWIQTGSIFVTVLITKERIDSLLIYLQLAFFEGTENTHDKQPRKEDYYQTVVLCFGEDRGECHLHRCENQFWNRFSRLLA